MYIPFAHVSILADGSKFRRGSPSHILGDIRKCADIRITPSTLSAHTWILCAVTHPESCPGPPLLRREVRGVAMTINRHSHHSIRNPQ